MPHLLTPVPGTLEELRRQHRRLDAEIDHTENGPGLASPLLKELKLRRLALRDHIVSLENGTPNTIEPR